MSMKSHNSVINEIKLPCGNSIYDSHELSNALAFNSGITLYYL